MENAPKICSIQCFFDLPMVEESKKNTLNLNKQKLFGCQVEVWSVETTLFVFQRMVVGLLKSADRSIDILKTR